MPNIFGLMAHRPDVLGKFLPFYSAVMEGGTVEPRYKELAYLKTALINGVRVLNTRTHRFGEANRNHRRANPGAAVLRPQPVV